MSKRTWMGGLLLLVLVSLWWWMIGFSLDMEDDAKVSGALELQDEGGGWQEPPHPLSIEYLRQQDYSLSKLVIEEQLSEEDTYSRSIASYESEGLTQFGLLAIPEGVPPAEGWPAIVFNHGYIPPQEYRTTEKYVAYLDGFAKQGYVVFKPDYRGHGNSEGVASGGYGSPDYTIDVLNALSAVKKLPEVDENRVGMWGHSMGGHITLRAMAVDPTIKAGVIWGGVVGSYQDYWDLWWGKRPTPTASPAPGDRGYWRGQLAARYGDFSANPDFWNSISVTSELESIQGVVQLHHAKGDETVPVELSQRFYERMRSAEVTGELFIYEGDNHNLSENFSTAMKRSVDFFDNHVKGEI
jgi:dipeptidyl aminopeptidase/acylaminoacyl peptidase